MLKAAPDALAQPLKQQGDRKSEHRSSAPVSESWTLAEARPEFQVTAAPPCRQCAGWHAPQSILAPEVVAPARVSEALKSCRSLDFSNFKSLEVRDTGVLGSFSSPSEMIPRSRPHKCLIVQVSVSHLVVGAVQRAVR